MSEPDKFSMQPEIAQSEADICGPSGAAGKDAATSRHSEDQHEHQPRHRDFREGFPHQRVCTCGRWQGGVRQTAHDDPGERQRGGRRSSRGES